jgi:hypothetical protein
MVAKRYGTLPSQVLKLGNSIDVNCALISLGYENYLNKKASGKDTGENLSQEDMLAMMHQVRGQQNGGNEIST